MKNKRWVKKLLSFILFTVMVLEFLPPMTASAGSLLNVADEGKIVDSPTVNNYTSHDVFPNNTTEKAGGVWTDKSVFKSVADYRNAIKGEEDFETDNALAEIGEDNFLVSLSAMASTKSIKGYSTIPTDTILVLDMSSSMKNSQSIEELAIAANSAIKALTAANYNNRVGLVLYSSEPRDDKVTYTNILLPLDRYSAGGNGNFIDFYGTENAGTKTEADHGLKVCQDVQGNIHKDVAGKQDGWHTGTFTQDGIYTAMNMLLDADKTVTTGVQAGTERMPVIVLMTDGEPYRSGSDYHGTNNTLDRITFQREAYDSAVEFVTQLTAAYAKYKLDNAYVEHDMLFYTLGMGVSHTAILDPKNSNEKDNTKTYWDGFLNTENGVYYAAEGNIDIKSSPSDFFAALKDPNTRDKYRYYVNRYFQASNAGALNNIFTTIVNEIILQSTYYPTDIESDRDALFGGYISMVDTLGDYMEVKDIKGLHLGNELYSGAGFASMLSAFGNITNPHPDGDEFVRAIKERFGIDKNEAQDLIGKAYGKQQLFYDSDVNYSNYIGWYGENDGSLNRLAYRGFWAGEENEDAAPVGADYYVKSYFFYGDAQNGTQTTKMMYTAVHVQKAIRDFTTADGTNIKKGTTKLYFRLPASLIPMKEYNIELNGEDYSQPRAFEIGGAEFPARLLFEVGLIDDINSINIADTAPNAKVENKEEYVFYSNRWGSTESSPLADNTHVFFYPSEENERYCYHQNAQIYVKNGDHYEPYSGTDKPTDTNYYVLKHVYTTDSEGVHHAAVYEPINQVALTKAVKENVNNGATGSWYIPKGTPRLYAARDVVYKIDGNDNKSDGGVTGTYNTSEYPIVKYDKNDVTNDYHIESVLGNNGKLIVKPAQGIQLHKYVDSNSETDDIYTFTIKSAEGTDSLEKAYTYYVAAIGENNKIGPISEGQTAAFDSTNNTITVKIKKDQVAYITDLPTGSYIIAEDITGQQYEVGSLQINDTYQQSLDASVQVEPNKLKKVEVLNIYDDVYGSLTISKNVSSSYQPHKTEEFDFSFTLTATLPDDVDPAYIKAYPTSIIGFDTQATNGGNLTFTSDNKTANVSFNLSHTEALQIPKLPAGTKVTVTETAVNKREATEGNDIVKAFIDNDKEYGFTTTYTVNNSGAASGRSAANTSITAGGHTNIVFTNTYAPNEIRTNNIEVKVIKEFTGRDNNKVDNKDNWIAGDKFDFILKSVNSTDNIATGFVEHTEDFQATPENRTKVLVNNEADFQTYSAAGTYSYEIDEIDGSIPGVTYDTNIEYFDVVVSDDGFGTLFVDDVKASDEDENNLLSVEDATEDTPWIVTAKFINTYSAEGKVSLDLSVQKEITVPDGIEMNDRAGYQFNLYQVSPNTAADNPFDDVEISGTPIQTGTTIASGAVDFADIKFTSDDEDIYYYIIEEVTPAEGDRKPGITYSQELYGIKATVSDVSETAVLKLEIEVYKGQKEGNKFINPKLVTLGKKDVVYIPGEGENDPGIVPTLSYGAVITNTYKPISVSTNVPLSGTKTLLGRDMKQDEKFIIQLWRADSDYKTIGDAPIETVEVGNGNANNEVGFEFVGFDDIIYTHENLGENYYVVKEFIPKEPETNMVYDTTEYKVCVTVSHDAENAALTALPVIYKGDGVSSIAFENKYIPASLTPSVEIYKQLLYSNEENRTIRFSSGIFSAGIYNKADENFENPLQIVPFGATDPNNSDKAKATFDNFATITETGEHSYVIRELPPNGVEPNEQGKYIYNGAEYDVKAYPVTIKVTYNNTTGRFEYTTTTTTDTIKNVYTAEKTEVTFNGTKFLEDTEFGNDSVKKFNFALYETDSSFTITEGSSPVWETEVEVKKSEEVISKDFSFTLDEYSKIGSHFYVLKEIPTVGNPLMVYDTNQYNITVIVSDTGKGQLVATSKIINVGLGTDNAQNALNFYNTMLHPGDISLVLNIDKTVIGSDKLKGYEFVLEEYDKDHNLVDKTNFSATDKDGKTKLDLTFGEDACDKTFYYELKEVPGSDVSIIYDKTVYKFSVKVELDHTNALMATVTTDENYEDKFTVQTDTDASAKGITASFTNIYVPPVTIDIFKTVKNVGHKKIEPKGFKFVLTETDKDYKPLSGGFVQTVTSDDIGSAVFDEISIKDGETRFFTVAEEKGSKKYVSYDDTVYKICIERIGQDITIVSDPNGTRVNSSLSLRFENTYDYPAPKKETPSDTPDPKPVEIYTPDPLISAPKTGDSTMAPIWTSMIVIGVLGFIATAYYALRRYTKKSS